RTVLAAQYQEARTNFKAMTKKLTPTLILSQTPPMTVTPTIKSILTPTRSPTLIPTISQITASPTLMQTSPTSVSNTSKMFGVNASGAEFGDTHLPGTE